MKKKGIVVTKRTMPKVNEAFRAWTRGTSFTLQMGKTQVALLVAIAVSRETIISLGHPMLRCYVPAIRNLEQRGLVRRPKGWTKDTWRESVGKRTPLISHQEPTEAGELILQLLKCAGVYDEIKRELMNYHATDEYGYHYEYRAAQ